MKTARLRTDLIIVANYIIYVITYNSLIINKLPYEKSKNYKDL